MKKIFLSVVFFLLITKSAFSQINFYFGPNQNPINLNLEEIGKIIQSNERPSYGGARAFPEVIDNFSPELKDKLRSLNQMDLYLEINNEYQQFLNFFGVSRNQATDLRIEFVDSAAKDIIEYLIQNPSMHIRILARDLNEIYTHIEFLLTNEANLLELSKDQRFEILGRVALVQASRPIIKKITTESQNPKSELIALFQLQTEHLNDRNFLLLDSGYEGSIVNQLLPYFKEDMDSRRVQWSFFWKAPHASHYISEFPLEKFGRKLKQLGLFEKFYRADLMYSFRVALMEHYPKWGGRYLNWSGDPVYIMLDLDDTVLKEIDINKFKDNERAQFIRYTPSESVRKKYQDRLKDPGTQNKSKVIHFEFNGNEMTGAVTVRLAIEEFLYQLIPLISTGKVRLLVTSNNDPSRTEAMIEQLKIGNVTLKQIGAEYIPYSQFNDEKFRKDMGKLRDNLGIGQKASVIAIDDLPSNYVRSNGNDLVEGVTAFAGEYVESNLNGLISDSDLSDRVQFNRLLEAIKEKVLVTEAQTAFNKVRAAYLAYGISLFTLERSQSKTISCFSLFQ